MGKSLLFCSLCCSKAVFTPRMRESVRQSLASGFSNGELTIPGVVVEGLHEGMDGKYYDIVLRERDEPEAGEDAAKTAIIPEADLLCEEHAAIHDPALSKRRG